MKQKISNLFIVIIFIAMITMPQVIGWIIGGDTKNEATTENRNLSVKPKLTVTTIKTYPKAFDSYYNDNLPFRNSLIKAWANINYDLFNTTIDSRVIIGKEGWLFYEGEEAKSIKQVQGLSRFSEEQKKNILENLEFNRDKLKKKGIEFYALVIPNKENIYKEYLPDTIKIKDKVSGTEELVEYVKNNSDVNIVYPKEELLEAKKEFQVYYKYDTHWNDIGACIGTISLLKAIDVNFNYNLNDIKIGKSNSMYGDLTKFANLSDKLSEDGVIITNFYPKIVYKTNKIQVNGIKADKIESFISNSENNKKVLVIGDSFRSAMRPYLSKLYREVIYIHRDNLNEKLIDEIKPDIVVHEVVERYSSNLGNKIIK